MLALNRQREPTPRERKFRIAREGGRVCMRLKCRTSFRGRSVSAWTEVHTNGDLTLVESRPAQRGSALACFSNSGFKFKYVLPHCISTGLRMIG